MKVILKIAKAELQKLFYSPVAWLVLVIYTFQTALHFTTFFDSFVKVITMGMETGKLTHRVYAGQFGLFSFFAGWSYLYVPLITMGLMSRELSTGSVKLLYSSPITNKQIILGKYLSMMAFGLVLIGILVVFALFGSIAIDHAEIPKLLCGLLGVYLLICAYAAIGLFISSLTPYVVVAAMGTLGVFSLLAYVKNLWQDIELVRDVTYWFSLSGRVDTFIKGMITSEDVLYFLIIILLFLSLTIVRLQSMRQRRGWMNTWGKFTGLFLIAVMLGYFSALPKLKGYLDLSYQKENTLSKGSQEVINKIPDNTTITTYTNMLGPKVEFTAPYNYKNDIANFENYQRFNPTLKVKYVYFYHKTDDNLFLDMQYPMLNDKQRVDTLRKLADWDFDIKSYEDIAGKVDLTDEGFRTIRVIETPAGNKRFLRFFSDGIYVAQESEISAAFKQLVDSLPVVGFLTGHGERSIVDVTDKGYNKFSYEKAFRYSLINQGFDFQNVTLDRPVPDRISILVIAEMRQLLTPLEQENLNGFIAKGGNLLIMGEPGRQEVMNNIVEPLGVRFMPGTLVHTPGKLFPTLVPLRVTAEGIAQSFYLEDIKVAEKWERSIVMQTATSLEIIPGKGFVATPWMVTHPDSCWIEKETTNFIEDTVRFNSSTGEEKKSYPTLLTLNRRIANKDQKIVIAGDADWLSAGELNISRNEVISNDPLFYGVFSWLSDNKAPIDVRIPPPIDNTLKIGKKGWQIMMFLFRWVLPSALMITGILIWIRRRGR